MKKAYIMMMALLTGVVVMAQPEVYDALTYELPGNYKWTKETGNNFVTYSHINKGKKSWCQIILYKRTASKGSIDADISSEWNDLVATQHIITGDPLVRPKAQQAGWASALVSGNADFNGGSISIYQLVITGDNNCSSVVIKTNSGSYQTAIDAFLASVGINGLRNDVQQPVDPVQQQNGVNIAGAARESGTAATNWDDAWQSVAKEDWAEVSRDGFRVLVHYPNQQADAYHSVLKEGLKNAWRILVEPRYSNLVNVEFKPIQSFESIAFAEADGTDKATGQRVHIVLFKKHYSNGNGRYLEIIAPDKTSFEREFGAYHNDEFGWDRMANMQFRNKFAVNVMALTGKWSASDYASLSYYYVNGGGFAGATATSISQEFTFFNDGKYESDQAGASGVVGNQRFSRQVYKGNCTANNWEMELTNRFQAATEKYSCHFEAVKGGFILVMVDRQGTVYSLVKRLG